MVIVSSPSPSQPNGLVPLDAPLRAAIYRRVSRKLQADGYSLTAQDKDGRAYADQIGADVVKVFEDVESGADWNLPGMDDMLDWASRNEFELLICPDPDRLARGLGKQLTVESELRSYGVEIAFLSLPKTGDDDADEFMRLVYGGIAEMERKKIRRRTQRGLREKVAQGLVVGNGVCPYGYEWVTEERRGQSRKPRVIGLSIDETTAPIVRRIVAELRTRSIPTVCAGLNAEDIPSPGGGRWSDGTIVDIVHSPTYVGRYYFGRTRQPKENGKRRKYRLDVSDEPYAVVPAIVSEAEMATTRAALAARKTHHGRRKASTDGDPYLLRGMLTCSYCKGPLACMPNGTTRYYQCLRSKPGRARAQNTAVCQLPPVPAIGLERLTWERVVETLADPDWRRAALAEARRASAAADRKAERLRDLAAVMEKHQKRLTELVIARADAETGSATRRAIQDAIALTEGDIKQLEAGLAELEAQPTIGLSADVADEIDRFGEDLRAAGDDDATPAERRRIYELLQLRAVARRDKTHGIKLARDNRFTFKWDAIIQLRNGERLPKAIRLSFRSADRAALAVELIA